jgi:16S rRNA (guanine(527)-N(7))-methyltransferase RsmG
MFQEMLAAEFGALSPDQCARLEEHFNTLTRWNKRINLTRIESIEDAVRLHYYESLLLASMLPEGPLRIADVGSGAGFPGIPVAVFRSDSSVCLIEAHRRKAVFLSEAARDLPNVSVIAGRAESSEWRGDWMIARAVKPANVLALHLAPCAALLISSEDFVNLPPPDRVERIPWSTNRVVATFHVEHGKIDKRG